MNIEPELYVTFVKMVLMMAVVVGCLWGFSWFVKNKQNVLGGKFDGKKIHVIENCHVGVKKTISLVKVPGAVLVVGIADNHMTLLHEIRENDTKNS
ncbi:MAG: flagellar biosynthetic protein FliO [Proteobacteria bacterium]|nr:flagellar biosynthetic protein FliO [Pseudomonadota bacterium]MBU4471513.1 flagellar biosynthetic protein FliO [Pseudomonadota bacterium]MCG2752519.1 flagellar biosynthetic protein FliO [Desulfobacteraceae bacterium]